MHILVRRTGALGDVLDTTAIVGRLRRENPDAVIDFVTAHPATYFGNPHVNRVLLASAPWSRSACDRFVDLDGIHEAALRRVHAIDAMSEHVFGDRDTPKVIVLRHDPEPPSWIKTDWSRTVVVHPARSWPQRTLPEPFWVEVISRLDHAGYDVVIVGTAQDWDSLGGFGRFRISNTCGCLTLSEQASVIHNAQCFLASDTGMINVAFATPTPIVWLGTMCLPWMMEHVRPSVDHFAIGAGFHPIMANVECVGCIHRIDRPVTFAPCQWEGSSEENKCVRAFDPAMVVAKVVEVMR